MSNRIRFCLMIVSAVMPLFACAVLSTPVPAAPSTGNPAPAPPAVPERLSFEGMWVSEGDAPEIIVFTKDSMYWAESDQVSADDIGVRERFAKVVTYDLENNHIALRTQWIRVNGQMFGFDAPNFNITYLIDGDALRIGIGWDEEFAAETEPLFYFRK